MGLNANIKKIMSHYILFWLRASTGSLISLYRLFIELNGRSSFVFYFFHVNYEIQSNQGCPIWLEVVELAARKGLDAQEAATVGLTNVGLDAAGVVATTSD